MVQLVEIGWRGSHGNNFHHFAKWPFGFLTMAIMVFDNQGKNRKSWVISGGIGAGGGRGGGGSKGGGRWWQWQLQRNLENYFFPIWIQNWNQFLWCCWSRFGPRLSPGPGGLTLVAPYIHESTPDLKRRFFFHRKKISCLICAILIDPFVIVIA